jgi:hypothetical protein
MYGASMLGELVRSTDNSLACEPFQKAVVQPEHGLPPLLLAERGGQHASYQIYCYVSCDGLQADRADVLLQDAILLRRPTMLRKLASRAFSSMTTP